MSRWIIGNLYTRNVVQIMSSTKNDSVIEMREIIRSGEWSCISDKKPQIDLDNEQGFEITASEYSWEMSFMSWPAPSWKH